jgi:hypothetical protein
MKRWKKLTICSVSFLSCIFAEIAINLACGPEWDPYDYYPSFFHNTIQNNDNYKSFYFNGLAFLNDDANPLNETDVNAREWAAHLGNAVSLTDVNKAMYELGARSDSLLLLKYLKPNGLLPDSLKKNTFLNALVSGKHNEALNYYRLVKTAEPFTSVNYDNRWNPIPRDDKKLKALSATALNYAHATKNQFIRLRCFYQAQRLLFYSGNRTEAAVIYDRYIEGARSKSHVMGWALSLRAGSEETTGNPAKAAYMFSKVFVKYPERRIQAFYEFNNINESQVSILKYAKTPDEKAFVYAIRGFHTSRVDITALQQVYKVQPRSPLIKVLLVREINKIEESYLSKKLDKTAPQNPYDILGPYTGEDSTAKKQRAYLPKLMTFCQRLADEGRYTEPAIGNLAIAYLNWIQGNTQTGLDELALIDDQKLNIKLDDQRQMISLLLQTQKITRLDTIAQQELVPALTWLNQKVKWEAHHIKFGSHDWWGRYSSKPYSASARDFYTLVLAPAYLKQKDTALAALAILKGERTIPSSREYQSPAPGFNMPDFLQRKLHSYDLLKVINNFNAAKKNPYLNLLTSEINRRVCYDLYDLLGTAYLREHKYVRAVKAFNKIPASISKHTPYTWSEPEYRADPFTDISSKKNSSAKSIKYTKPMFARKMAKLQRLIKTDPKNAAKYYYLMATGLYNTSQYGNAWFLTTYFLANYDKERDIAEYYDNDFLLTRQAEQYCKKARDISNDAEFKARCTFIAAACKQNAMPYFSGNNKKRPGRFFNDQPPPDATKNPYFNELKKYYSKTSYYKLTVMECSYYQDFLHPQPKKPKQTLRVIVK